MALRGSLLCPGRGRGGVPVRAFVRVRLSRCRHCAPALLESEGPGGQGLREIMRLERDNIKKKKKNEGGRRDKCAPDGGGSLGACEG